MIRVGLRTGVWYNDRPVELTFPDSWDVVTHWPDTPPPLTERQIRECISNPVGQPPLRELARGKTSPLLIVDDLARPTPAFRLMPFLLEEFQNAGIPPSDVRILVATGTHGKQDREALANKLGRDAVQFCEVLVHSDRRRGTFLGKTSFGTPVIVNREVPRSDLIAGIGGVYPQHTTGFGGGGKLALGVLGRRSIVHLHYGDHGSVDGSYEIDNDFRRDVTEISRMVGLSTLYTLHTNADLELVHLTAGDHFSYYPQAAEFSRQRYMAPLSDSADVVVANTYPSDLSYTFMRKGLKPLRSVSPGATKIAIASNHEGIGKHGIFPQGGNRRWNEHRELMFRISTMNAKTILKKIWKNLPPTRSVPQSTGPMEPASDPALENLWLFRPDGEPHSTPAVDGIQIVTSWDRMLSVIRDRHGSKAPIKVRIYPCSSLQCMEAPALTE